MRQRGIITPAVYDGGGSRYCGPTSLSAITGHDTATITKFIRRKFRPGPVKGMHNKEAIAYLRHCGYEVDLVYRSARLGYCASHEIGKVRPVTKPMNLRKWIDEYARGREVYLINVTQHYVVLHSGMIVCTSRSGKPVPAGEIKSMSKQAERVWRVT